MPGYRAVQSFRFRVKACVAAVDEEEGAIAVVLDLVQPMIARRWLLGERRQHRLDESRRREWNEAHRANLCATSRIASQHRLQRSWSITLLPRRRFGEGSMAGGRIDPAWQPKRGADRSALRAPAPLPERIAACAGPVPGDGIGKPSWRAVVAVARLAIHPHPRGLRSDLAQRRNWAWP
jgi:hypothetical protein